MLPGTDRRNNKNGYDDGKKSSGFFFLRSEHFRLFRGETTIYRLGVIVVCVLQLLTCRVFRPDIVFCPINDTKRNVCCSLAASTLVDTTTASRLQRRRRVGEIEKQKTDLMKTRDTGFRIGVRDIRHDLVEVARGGPTHAHTLAHTG